MALVVVSVSIIIAIITDLDKMIIPNWLTYSLILSAPLFWTIDSAWEGLFHSLLSIVLSGLIFLIPAWFNQVGMGDVKLMAGIGGWTSVKTVLLSFVLASLVGLLITIAVLVYKMAYKKRKYSDVRKEPIPYAPALGIGVLTVMWGPFLV